MKKKTPRSITLKQVLLWFTGLLIASLLVVNFMLNVSSAKRFMQQQMSTHAQDAATSLGLLLSSVIDANDLVGAESMIDAMFDRGYYRYIIYYDALGEAKVVRHSSMSIEGVPSWFVDRINLQADEGKAEVMNGWSQLGSVSVASHPGLAYIKLWDSLKIELVWYTLIAAIAFLVMQLVITTILLPLTRVEKQAKAIRQRDFSFRAPMPKTRELRRVAVAMNSMSDKLQGMFEKQLSLIEHLREQSFHDPVTGLSNRMGFDGRLKAELESEQSVAVGTLCLIQLKEFSSYNQKHGRKRGDELLVELAETIKSSTSHIASAFAARRSGADFSVFLPGLVGEQADSVANDLLQKMSGLHSIKQICRNDILHIGIASTINNLSLSEFLSEADMALRSAQAGGPNGWQRYVNDSGFITPGESVRQAGEWQKILENVLAERRITFHFQPVYSGDREAVLHHQVLSRIEVNGELVVAGVFIPMAERFSLLPQFDQLVVEKMIEMAEQDTTNKRYCINLSEHSLADDDFVEWFLDKMAEHRKAAKAFIFEVSEYSLQLANESLEKVVAASARLGFEVAIDKFGVAAVPFAYLQHLSIHYIKLDQSFIRDIQLNRDNQFFLRSVLQIAHGQDIQVIAVGVEFEDEWNSIAPLGIDGAMGYYLGRPLEQIEE